MVPFVVNLSQDTMQLHNLKIPRMPGVRYKKRGSGPMPKSPWMYRTKSC